MALIGNPDLNYFYGKPGMRMKEGRYETLRQIGQGSNSVVWLVRDTTPSPPHRHFYALKVLTTTATEKHQAGGIVELGILQRMKENEQLVLVSLFDHFFIDGFSGPHLALVLGFLGEDAVSFGRMAPTKILRPYIVKNIVMSAIEAVASLHKRGFVHTSVKAAKVLRFVESYDCEAYVVEDLDRNPPEVIREFEHQGERYSVYKSQPVVGAGNFCPGWDMPHMDSEGEIYTLIDLGHGYWADQPFDVEGLGSAARQTPEAILGLGIDTPVDVWSLGCMVFELLIGEPLFNVANVDGTSGEAELLARILEVTGERFSREVLDKARFKDKFYDADGNFMHKKELKPTSIEERLAARKTLPESEVAPAADLIRKCVRLDPADRATAREIFTHPWCYGVFCCGPPY